MGNCSSGSIVRKSLTLEAGAKATGANPHHQRHALSSQAPPTAIEATTRQLAVSMANKLETAETPVSFSKLFEAVGHDLLKYMTGSEANALLLGCTNDDSLMAKHPVGQLHSLKQNSNRGYLPTVDKLKANLKLLGETQPDKSMSRHALASLVALNELNNHPDSEKIPSHRLGALALATLDHLNDGDINDGDIDHINIKTELNPDQLQQVIDLLGTLPAAHPERTKIDQFVGYLTTKLTHIQTVQNAPFDLWTGTTYEQIRNDYDVALASMHRGYFLLALTSLEFQANREIAGAAVEANGLALQFANRDLQSDPEVVKKAVKQYGRALQYASDALKADREVVKYAVQKHGGAALEYASVEFQRDPARFLWLLSHRKAGFFNRQP